MKAYRGTIGKAPLTLNQHPKWRPVVNSMSQLLSHAKQPRYPLNRGLDKPQTWSVCLREAISAPPSSIYTHDYLPHNLVATPNNLKNTYLNLKRNCIPHLPLLISRIMEPHNLASVFKRAFGNFMSVHHTG